MRRLLAVIVAVAVLYSAGWFVLAGQAMDRQDAAIAAARALGWEIDWGARSRGGFPNRVDVTYADFRVVAPSGNAWEGDRLQLFQLVYRPRDMIAVVGERHRITLDGEVWEVTIERGEASFHPRLGDNLLLWPDPVTVGTGAVTATGAGTTIGWGSGLLASRDGEDDPLSEDIFLRLAAVTTDADPEARLLELDLTRRQSGDGEGTLKIGAETLTVSLRDRWLELDGDRSVELPALP